VAITAAAPVGCIGSPATHGAADDRHSPRDGMHPVICGRLSAGTRFQGHGRLGSAAARAKVGTHPHDCDDCEREWAHNREMCTRPRA
jgi:hypothetical protein